MPGKHGIIREYSARGRGILMVTVEIIGHHKRLSKDFLSEVFFWGISEIMPSRRKLDVTISLCDLEGDATGYHWNSDRYTHEIELEEKQSTSDLITALFHELVHVRQTSNGIYADDNVPYYERPTEIEAYQLQEELYTKWKKSPKVL